MDMKFSNLAGGAVQEKFDAELVKVIANLLDPNTPWKNKRSLTLKVTITQNEDRTDTKVEYSVEKKLAQTKPITTSMAIGKDLDTGEIYAEEYGSQIRGQMSLPLDDMKSDSNETGTVVDGMNVDTETGEVKEQVVDFRAMKQA